MTPTEVSPAHVHAFAYAAGPSGKEPSPSTVVVRLAAISGFYDFARRSPLNTMVSTIARSLMPAGVLGIAFKSRGFSSGE